MAGPPSDAPTCVEFAQAERIDPVGTAGHYLHVAVVEIPPPWPRDVGEHPEVAPLAAELKAAGVRLQAVVPRAGGTLDNRRLAHYWRPEGPFRSYGVTERTFADHALGDALAELARSARTGQHLAEAGRSVATHPADVLICAHGKRDQCCGSHGTRLATRLGDPWSSDNGGNQDTANGSASARVWRTSHTGGHRFAPTALVLPEGTAWAFLDEHTLPRILDRSLDVGAAADLYRGCTGLADPALQVCDREALRTLGWSWLEHARNGRVLDRDGDRTTVRLEHTNPVGEAGAFEATVEVARTLPVPECRRPIAESRKTSAELRIVAFRRL